MKCTKLASLERGIVMPKKALYLSHGKTEFWTETIEGFKFRDLYLELK